MANVHLAMKQNLTIIPVINKIDLPNADIPTVKKQLEDILTISAEEAILASAKTGLGVEASWKRLFIASPRRSRWPMGNCERWSLTRYSMSIEG